MPPCGTHELLGYTTLRSILPAGINVMALTATATVETFDIVSQHLSMKDPTLVTSPPNRDNIIYRVHPKATLNELTDDLCSEFRTKRTEFPKTVIFVRQYRDCSDIYLMIRHELGVCLLSHLVTQIYLNLGWLKCIVMF